eukprot:TRINITY_DN8183_c0_g1_i1.p1 TRINITY_DN8183_c0_g1~~TRINITY_DN8183_c0_g1_i1.p1  ORF type:complete len:181 (+),score=23.45 TRINITY_DN8183_c0_g1_i1:2-544(+)
MIRRPPRSTQSRSSAASDVYKRQTLQRTKLSPELRKLALPKINQYLLTSLLYLCHYDLKLSLSQITIPRYLQDQTTGYPLEYATKLSSYPQCSAKPRFHTSSYESQQSSQGTRTQQCEQGGSECAQSGTQEQYHPQTLAHFQTPLTPSILSVDRLCTGRREAEESFQLKNAVLNPYLHHI